MILYIYILTFSHPHHTFSQPSHFILAPYTANCHKRMSRRCRMSEMCQHFLTHSHTFYSCTLYHDAPTDIGWRRCVGCLILIGHFPQKSSIISGSFAERDLHLKVSSGHPLHLRHPVSLKWMITNVAYRVAKTHRIPYLYRSFSAK